MIIFFTDKPHIILIQIGYPKKVITPLNNLIGL